MKVKMISNQSGSNNGIQIEMYKQGQEYDLGEDLGSVFLKMGVCELVKKEKKMEKEEPNNKANKKSPENKASNTSLSNRTEYQELKKMIENEKDE